MTFYTIMPTPLGADNVIAAETFHINIVSYISAHALISLPSLLIMALAHYFWQKYLDKKENADYNINMENLKQEEKTLEPWYYGILPMLPLILVIVIGISFPKLQIGLVTISFISLIVTILIDTLRKKNIKHLSSAMNEFFKGMGTGLSSVVTLLVAAGLLVEGLKALGILKMLMTIITSTHGAGIIVPLVFSSVTGLIGLISGSGLAVFYGTVNLIPDLAKAANIPPQSISLPLQMVANLIRSISPVSAVIVIVATTMGVSPTQLIKRTSVPILIGIASVLILTYFTLLI